MSPTARLRTDEDLRFDSCHEKRVIPFVIETDETLIEKSTHHTGRDFRPKTGSIVYYRSSTDGNFSGPYKVTVTVRGPRVLKGGSESSSQTGTLAYHETEPRWGDFNPMPEWLQPLVDTHRPEAGPMALPPVIPNEPARAVIGLPQQLDIRTLVESVLKTQRGVFSGERAREVAQGTLRWLAEAGVALYLDGEPFRLWGHSPDSLRRLLDERGVFAEEDENPSPEPTVGAMMADLVAEDDPRPGGCPDGGACHHACASTGTCFRVNYCGPLSGVYPGNTWPQEVKTAENPERALGTS